MDGGLLQTILSEIVGHQLCVVWTVLLLDEVKDLLLDLHKKFFGHSSHMKGPIRVTVMHIKHHVSKSLVPFHTGVEQATLRACNTAQLTSLSREGKPRE